MGFAPASDVCKLVPEQEVGPSYVANEMIRKDIRESRAGFPLALELMVLDSRTRKPLPRAAIDVWHCDALGLYAGYTAMNPTEDGGLVVPAGRFQVDPLRAARLLRASIPSTRISTPENTVPADLRLRAWKLLRSQERRSGN